MTWNYTKPEDGLVTRTLSVFLEAKSSARIAGLERGNPMFFWTQGRAYYRIPYRMDLTELAKRKNWIPLYKALKPLKPVVEEERTIVYLPPHDPAKKRAVKQGALP